MAYTKTNWLPRQGTNLNKFTKSAETPASVILTNTPDAVTQPGTPFSVENMNRIEQGIFDAHEGISRLSDTLTSHADMVDGMGRNLLDVLGVSSIPAAMAALRTRCNGTGTPNFRGLMVGDYLDGLDLSAIPSENGGTAGQAWNNTYKNNQIVISAFNPYKRAGDTEVTKNHIRFDFRNVPLRKRMNPTNDNTGGYPATEMRAFLDGANGDGTGSKAGVTTAAFLNALKTQIGDYILPVRRMLSNKAGWDWITLSLWLPSENEIFGANAWGEANRGDGQKLHIPLYQKSFAYRTKRYNNSRQSYWLNTPSSGSTASFCLVPYPGYAGVDIAGSVYGCAPAFCVA
ncbi:MAG: DUF6273 domain-containing protein [Treponema sp.]|jgi:hypothetical protein|nr:DUF6273 domain-containing protein [Treponema sp.]